MELIKTLSKGAQKRVLMEQFKLERIPDSPPEIKPFPAGTIRPLWSVMIPAYNCSIYLEKTITSVLLQDMGADKMQIEVVDDASTDADVEALVKRIGKGRVGYFRQAKNVGSLRNFETCINRAKGQIIHLLHGDDRVKPGYYEKITELFKRYPEAGAAYSAWDYIDDKDNFIRHSRIEEEEDCILEDWLFKLAEHQRLQYACISVKREVYEKLGSFYGVIYGEDWEMWARIAKHYPTAYTPEFMVEYREHESTISMQSFLSGNNIRDINKVIQTIYGYLTPEEKKRMHKKAHRHYLYWAYSFTKDVWYQTKNNKIVYKQCRESLKVYQDPRLAMKMGILLMRIWAEPIIRLIRPQVINKDS